MQKIRLQYIGEDDVREYEVSDEVFEAFMNLNEQIIEINKAIDELEEVNEMNDKIIEELSKALLSSKFFVN